MERMGEPFNLLSPSLIYDVILSHESNLTDIAWIKCNKFMFQRKNISLKHLSVTEKQSKKEFKRTNIFSQQCFEVFSLKT